eukprot:Lithocolla_globosa_v1_NODE_2311_length_2055_cov_24.745500.p3 type:complete len:133 gc:universal NODE_2311_length_2055_cov_24.745500:1193-1591(+)
MGGGEEYRSSSSAAKGSTSARQKSEFSSIKTPLICFPLRHTTSWSSRSSPTRRSTSKPWQRCPVCPPSLSTLSWISPTNTGWFFCFFVFWLWFLATFLCHFRYSPPFLFFLFFLLAIFPIFFNTLKEIFLPK